MQPFSVSAPMHFPMKSCARAGTSWSTIWQIIKTGRYPVKKEQDTLRDMRIVQEMYARGFDFMPLDIYRAKARDFQIIDGKLMPSLSSIDGLGEKAADAVVDAVKDGPFLSVEDFQAVPA